MSLLRDLYKQHVVTEKKNDLSRLSPDVINDIQKNIRDGAENLEQKWANALELVHKAYDVAGVQRPTPDMEEAWKQYEENIQYAVEQLKKARGMDGDWRMSSAMFHEALNEAQQKQQLYRVTIKDGKGKDTYRTHAPSIDHVIEAIKDKDTKLHDVHVQRPDDDIAIVRFSKFNVKSNTVVRIEHQRTM